MRKMFLFLFAILNAQAQTGTWTPAAPLNEPRYIHTATLLPDGRVLAVGGFRLCSGNTCTFATSTESYQSGPNTWFTHPAPRSPRAAHAAALLPDGRVLIAGGDSPNGERPTATELFDPNTNTWSDGPPLSQGRSNIQAVVLPDGRALFVGGSPLQPTTASSDVSEVFDPTTNQWTPTGRLNIGRAFHTLTLLADGRVLAVGGSGANLRSAELFDPATNSWTRTGDLSANRLAHSAVLLSNGQVLVAGGTTAAGARTAEIWNPATGQWRTVASMSLSRYQPSLALLLNNEVLAVGGADAASRESAEIYDPEADAWRQAPSPSRGRQQHTTTQLPDGRILIAGGSSEVNPAEFFTTEGSPLGVVSAANYRANSLLAPASLASAFGANLAPTARSAPSLPLPTTLEGSSLTVRDSSGTDRPASLLFVSPSVINFEIPANTTPGPAFIISNGPSGPIARGRIQVQPISPGLFAADGTGLGFAAAGVLRVQASGAQTIEAVARYDTALNRYVANQIDFGPASDQLFLLLYGTGIRAATTTRVTIGGLNCEVLFSGPSPEFPGVDQVNVRLPRELAGRGEVTILLHASRWAANPLRLHFR